LTLKIISASLYLELIARGVRTRASSFTPESALLLPGCFFIRATAAVQIDLLSPLELSYAIGYGPLAHFLRAFLCIACSPAIDNAKREKRLTLAHSSSLKSADLANERETDLDFNTG
jgi:hypothetical protein